MDLLLDLWHFLVVYFTYVILSEDFNLCLEEVSDWVQMDVQLYYKVIQF